MDDFSARAGAAFVAGGSGGIGREVAVLLAERGSDVALTYRTNAAAAGDVAGRIKDGGRRATAWQLDLTDAEAVARVVGEAVGAFGGLHTLVYAAGPHVPMRHLSTVAPDELRTQLHADTAAFFNLTAAALPFLRELGGSLVAITTAATSRFPVRDGLSSAPKAAIEALVRGLAAEEGRYGVRANCIGPGMLTDGMAERLMTSGDLDERALEAARGNIPMRRFGRARDVAEAACFLASDRAGFITGQKLDVDGGYGV